MIINLPMHMFARLLPPGIQNDNRRLDISVEALKQRSLPTGTDSTSLLEKSHDVSYQEDDDIPLGISESISEDESVDNRVAGSDSPTSTQSVDSKGNNRRVRFDEDVQVTEIPKVRRDYPKTPPPNKKAIRSEGEETEVNDDQQGEKPATKPKRTRRTSQKTPAETTLTPRRMSLRSASKLAAKMEEKESKPVEATKLFSDDPVENEETKATTTSKPATTTPRARRRSSKVPMETTITPRRSSRRLSRSSIVVNDESGMENKCEEGAIGNTVADKEQNADCESDSPKVAATSSAPSKQDKLKALTLLGRIPKASKRELLQPLQEYRKGDNNSNHLVTLFADLPATKPLMELLIQHPSLIETVLLQLRSYEG